jgi:hypothetical protein
MSARRVCNCVRHNAARVGLFNQLGALATVAFAFWVAGTQVAQALDYNQYTLQIDNAAIEPGTTIVQGKVAVIRCHWSATFGPKLGYQEDYHVVAQSAGTGGINITSQKTGWTNTVKTFDHLTKPGYYTIDSPKGEFKSDWIPDVAGAALIKCWVKSPWQGVPAEKLLPIWVTPPPFKKDSGPISTAPQSLSLPPNPPKLEIMSASAALTGTCPDTGYGHVLTAKVNIKNSGEHLASQQGVVYVFGKTEPQLPNGFFSQKVDLPEINTGEIRMVGIEVNWWSPVSLKDYLTKVSGTTRFLYVKISPKSSASFPNVGDFKFPVSYPPDLCGPKKIGLPTAPTMAPAGAQATQAPPRSGTAQRSQTSPAASPMPQRPGTPR